MRPRKNQESLFSVHKYNRKIRGFFFKVFQKPFQFDIGVKWGRKWQIYLISTYKVGYNNGYSWVNLQSSAGRVTWSWMGPVCKGSIGCLLWIAGFFHSVRVFPQNITNCIVDLVEHYFWVFSCMEKIMRFSKYNIASLIYKHNLVYKIRAKQLSYFGHIKGIALSAYPTV